MITDLFSSFFELIKNKNGVLLSIDFGLKNVGIAISDNLMKIAMPLVVLNNNQSLVSNIFSILKDHKCIGIICGWPIDYNGNLHKISDNILFLCGNLFKISELPILLFDESMSTRSALDEVYKLNTKFGDNFIKKVGKNKNDHLAAQYILKCVIDKICDKQKK